MFAGIALSAVFRVSDESAGQRLRCQRCRAVIPEFDDLEEMDVKPARRRRSKTRPRREVGNVEQPLPWMDVAGISIAVLLLLVMVLFLKRGSSNSSTESPTEWTSNPALTATLDREVNLNGYSIRPPHAWSRP